MLESSKAVNINIGNKEAGGRPADNTPQDGESFVDMFTQSFNRISMNPLEEIKASNMTMPEPTTEMSSHVADEAAKELLPQEILAETEEEVEAAPATKEEAEASEADDSEVEGEKEEVSEEEVSEEEVSEEVVMEVVEELVREAVGENTEEEIFEQVVQEEIVTAENTEIVEDVSKEELPLSGAPEVEERATAVEASKVNTEVAPEAVVKETVKAETKTAFEQQKNNTQQQPQTAVTQEQVSEMVEVVDAQAQQAPKQVVQNTQNNGQEISRPERMDSGALKLEGFDIEAEVAAPVTPQVAEGAKLKGDGQTTALRGKAGIPTPIFGAFADAQSQMSFKGGEQGHAQSNSNALNGTSAKSKSGAAGAKGGKTKELPQNLQNKAIERIKQILEQARMNQSNNTLVVRLDPPQLGAVTVKLTQKADQLFARVIPDNADVEAMLRTRTPELIHVLAQSGLRQDNVHVTIGRDSSESDMFKFQQFLNGQDGQHGNNNKSQGQSGNQQQDIPQGSLPKPSSVVELAGWVA